MPCWIILQFCVFCYKSCNKELPCIPIYVFFLSLLIKLALICALIKTTHCVKKPRHTKTHRWLHSVSIVQDGIIGMWATSSELCVSDAVGRSHGDVNCDSLLVQAVRCRSAKKHWEERTMPRLTCCHVPQSVKSNCIYEELTMALAMWFDLMSWECVTRASKGEGRTWEIPLNYCKRFFWWLMVGGCQGQHDKLCQERITLSHFSDVYLSAFLFLPPSPICSSPQY